MTFNCLKTNQLKTIFKNTIQMRLKMVRTTGFEPVAYGLEGRCSIQLS